MADKYSVFYDIHLYFVINDKDIVEIDHDDVVSFTFSNMYDTHTYPMIRLRLYSDLSVLQSLTDSPDSIRLRGTINGSIYEVIDNSSPRQLKPISNDDIDLKVYMEMKNIATSKMDKYSTGLPRSMNDVLNVTNKVPIEVFCYDDRMIHAMKDQAQAVFNGMNLETALGAMFEHAGIVRETYIQSFHNGERFDQILVPNLSIIDTISFFDTVYGLYPKGGMMFEDAVRRRLYICDLDSSSGESTVPIYVTSVDNNSDMGGLREQNNQYYFQTEFSNVSVLTESDIERVLRAEKITSVNVETLESSTVNLPFYEESESAVENTLVTKQANDNISPTLMLHKSTNPYVASMSAARIEETVTRIDVSGAGWDVFNLNPATRYNLIFESPLRGIDMAAMYRAAFVNSVLTHTGTGLYVASTTMTLCKN